MSAASPPPSLNPEAAAIWMRIVAPYTGKLSVVDGVNLRSYCAAIARYEKAERMLAEGGPVVRSGRGVVINPLQAVVHSEALMIAGLGARLEFLAPRHRTAAQEALDELAGPRRRR
jgi:phage terminase small subunit